MSRKKKGKKKKEKGIIQKLKEKIKVRRILKPSQMTVRIPNRPQTSAWDEPSRFFKQEMEETKKSLFL